MRATRRRKWRRRVPRFGLQDRLLLRAWRGFSPNSERRHAGAARGGSGAHLSGGTRARRGGNGFARGWNRRVYLRWRRRSGNSGTCARRSSRRTVELEGARSTEGQQNDAGRIFDSRRHALGRCGDQRGACARRGRDAAKSRRHLRCNYHHAARQLRQGLPLADCRIRRSRQLGGRPANGSLRQDQPERHCGLGVRALRAGRNGYRKACEGRGLGRLVVTNDAMRRFVAGHKARLRPARRTRGFGENDGFFARAKL